MGQRHAAAHDAGSAKGNEEHEDNHTNHKTASAGRQHTSSRSSPLGGCGKEEEKKKAHQDVAHPPPPMLRALSDSPAVCVDPIIPPPPLTHLPQEAARKACGNNASEAVHRNNVHPRTGKARSQCRHHRCGRHGSGSSGG